MKAPLPPHEVERLKALHNYQILDTPPEIAFERVVQLAVRSFDVPMATVSLLDADRQWFKACFGMNSQATPRDSSFCAHTILSERAMVVSDSHADPRFFDNPSVLGVPYIRAYAGVPLKAAGGQNIGTLCVIDTKPRQFSAKELEMLSDLAAIVMDEMELRRTARELRDSESVLRLTLRKNNQLAVAVTSLTCGVIITDPCLSDNPIIFANAGFYNMTGYTPEETIGRNPRFMRGADTDLAVVEQIRQAVAARTPFNGIILNHRKDGTPFLNELIINPVFDEEGDLISFVGLQNEVTEREQTRQMLESRVSERTAELAQSQIEILKRLARAAEYRDDDTGQHTQRVARTTALLSRAMGLPEEQVALIQQAAPLHDVGKIAISDMILLKPGKLSDEEFATMQTHAAMGASLLANGQSEVVQMAERIAGAHHERWDGRGYPARLAAERIPLEGRLLAVADVFDALTHERPYKKAWSVQDAVTEIAGQSGKQFDPQIVAAFLQLPHDNLT